MAERAYWTRARERQEHFVQTRLRIATAGTTLLLIGGVGLAYAPTSSASAPSPSASPVPASSAPTSAPAQGGIDVPAGNAGMHQDSDGSGSTGAVVLLLGAGGLLIAGGSTVAIRRRS